MPDSRRYNDEDVQAIISRALAQQGNAKAELTHADLVAIGDQVGVPAAAIEQAARDVLAARRETEATERVRSARKRWLAAHAAVCAVINGLLFTVNALTTPGEWWFLFSAVFWGLALAGHSAFALAAPVSPKRQQRERARIDAAARPQLRVTETAPEPEALHEPSNAASDGSAKASRS